MEKFVEYLEALGYEAEEQGKINKYITILKGKKPIGFLLPDMTLTLVDKDEEDGLKGIIDFINKYKNLELVGGSEYILATHTINRMTTYFDIESKQAKYAVYIVAPSGEVISNLFDDYETAAIYFITATNLISSDLIKVPVKKGSVRNRFLNHIIKTADSLKSV